MKKPLLICLVLLLIVLKIKNKPTKNLRNEQVSSSKIPLPLNRPLMFGRLSCPYTVKMIDELKKHRVFNMFVYVNTETQKGSQLMKQYGGEGVPFFVSKERKGHGFMPKSKLFEKLNL
jgi:hypothetical protein